MKIVKFLAEVDTAKCKGDKLCETMCATGAIQVFEKKARVEAEICVACTRCVDRCPEEAVAMVRRPEPRMATVSTVDIDEAEIKELCLKAHRRPEELVCICTGTCAGEIAAAIIKGARSIREVVQQTAVITGCQEMCVPVVQRMLKAYGVELAEAELPLAYDQSFSLWDFPQEVGDKYPWYCFEEDAEFGDNLRKG